MNASRLAGMAATLVGMIAAPMCNAVAQTGTVEGTVVLDRSLAPLDGVRISVVGTSLGVSTDRDGSFRITDVPVGTRTVNARLIGYNAVDVEVMVSLNQVVEINFAMRQAVLSLEAVMVTGTAGQARRREIGNSISQMNMAEMQEPVSDVASALQGKMPGVNIMESGSASGAGRSIRLRGNISVAMSNNPLIYVDGVRMRSDPYPTPEVANDDNTSTGAAGGALNSIDPADIERVEVIKGAAATTLYGTESAAGVIQIFTKRGRAGRAEWTLAIDQGFSEMMMDIGPEWKPKMGLDPWLKKGYRSRYALSVGGGTEAARYQISGSFTDNTGIVPTDGETRSSARVNLSLTPARDLQVDWNSSYSKSDIRNVSSGNNANGLGLNVYRTGAAVPRNYVGSEEKVVIDSLFDLEHLQAIEHLTTGLTLRH